MVCTIPFGFPVVPDVYRMYRGCSASIGSAGASAGCPATTSCHHTSRPGAIGTSSPVRRSTTTCSIVGVPATAASAFAFNGTTCPRRYEPSIVTSTLASASLIRSFSASAENPPNTTECGAPSRAQASIATGSSGTMPM